MPVANMKVGIVAIGPLLSPSGCFLWSSKAVLDMPIPAWRQTKRSGEATRRWLRLSTLRRGLQEAQELVWVDRLGKVEVEAGLLRSAPVLLLSVAGEGDQAGRGGERLAPQGCGYFVPVHPR